jgi:3-hydroxyacyl-CoA dehydrogenase/enoyl-CoA hydratase/3-hydroxybutyryl-CoA epimerase
MNNTIQYSVDKDGIATLLLDLPGKSMNVLCDEMISELSDCIEKIAADENVTGAVLASAKATFVAGADLTELVTAYDRGITVREGYEWSRQLNAVLRRMETCGKAFAVAINGLALGGGLELCLAGHYRVMADHPKAQLGLPDVSIGLMPCAGGTQRLPRLTGV